MAILSHFQSQKISKNVQISFFLCQIVPKNFTTRVVKYLFQESGWWYVKNPFLIIMSEILLPTPPPCYAFVYIFDIFLRGSIITVDYRLFEPTLIRITRLFEVVWRSPWVCLPNSGKNSLGYSNFSYSNNSVIRIFLIEKLSNENIDFL